MNGIINFSSLKYMFDFCSEHELKCEVFYWDDNTECSVYVKDINFDSKDPIKLFSGGQKRCYDFEDCLNLIKKQYEEWEKEFKNAYNKG